MKTKRKPTSTTAPSIKIRKDCALKSLDPAQLLQLFEWLELLPTTQVLKRVAAAPPKGFGLRVNLNTLYRYHARARRTFAAELLADLSSGPDTLDVATTQSVRHFALQLSSVHSRTPQTFNALSRWVIRNQEVAQRERTLKLSEERVRLGQEHLVLESKRLTLDREKFEFNAARAALLHLDRLRDIRVDDDLDDEAKILAVRRAVFGTIPEDVANATTAENSNPTPPSQMPATDSICSPVEGI